MQRRHNRDTIAAVELLHQLEDLDLVAVVEVGSRFVEKEDIDALHKCHGDPHPPAGSARSRGR